LGAKAAASPRKRSHHNIHESPSDPVQRFLVAAEQETYFRPHRHHTKSELALIMRGSVELVTFDDAGRITARHGIGDDTSAFAYETPSSTWHTLIAGPRGATFLEIKEGPYDPATAVEFASWAPAEGDESVPQFLEWIRRAGLGDEYDQRARLAT
jgi:cupin fold WbuC family metalloprotein